MFGDNGLERRRSRSKSFNLAEEEEKKIDEEQGQENEEPWRVLIANDDPLQLTILKVIFEKCDFVTTTAQNGQIAYEKVL